MPAKPKRTQIAADVPPELLERIQSRAKLEDRTVKSILIRALNAYLDTPVNGESKEKPARKPIK